MGLFSLDRYEGYPHLYTKRYVSVKLGGKSVRAMVYTMTDGHELGTPSPFYYSSIRAGYASAGFDEAVLREAVEASMA